MLVDGMILGTLTLAAGVMVYKHLPVRIKAFIERHPLAVRAGAFIFTYKVLGESVTSLFAAAIFDILLSILLSIKNDAEASAGLQAMMTKFKNFKNSIIRAITGYLKTGNEKEVCEVINN